MSTLTDPFLDDRAIAKLDPVWAGRVCGFWLGLFPIVDFIFRAPIDRASNVFAQIRYGTPQLAIALASIALAGLIPSLWIAATYGLDFRRAKYLAPAAFLVCLAVPLSYIGETDIQNMLYVVLIYNAFVSAIFAISTNLDREIFLRSVFQIVALLHAGIMAVVLIDHDVIWGRLYGRNTPNYWGMVAQTALICSMAMRGWVLRGLVILISVAVMIMAQTRGSMVASAAGFSLAFLILSLKARQRVWLWLAGALTLAVVLLLGVNFVAEDLLKLSDPTRGLASGGSGRSVVWRESWDLFASHPWTGVGYRQHEKYLTSEATAHNAYLATLADLGVIGFSGYILFIGGGALRALRKVLAKPNAVELTSVAFLTAFMVNGLVERSALNTGNTYSQLMLVLAAWAWRQDNPADPA